MTITHMKGMGMRIWYLSVIVCVLGGTLLVGCPERVFNAMDVDVAAVDGSGNPTEIFITDLGSNTACEAGVDSKILRVDLDGNVLWTFDAAAGALQGAHNADLNEAGDQMIISDSCNHRVLVISYPAGDILWDSSTDCPELGLTFPNDANFLGNGWQDHLLITVHDDQWVIEVDPLVCNGDGIRDEGEIVWSFGAEGEGRIVWDVDDKIRLLNPHNADILPNGNIIIADSGLDVVGPSRVIEVDIDYPGEPNKIVWAYKPLGDCTIKGVPDQACPALTWGRDADVECGDPACDTGMVIVTGLHQTVGVERDLSEAPPPGEEYTRGRVVAYQVQHGVGFCYDSDKIQQWDGGTNGGLGYFLVSNHGPLTFGSWVRVVPVGAFASDAEYIWQLQGNR